MSSLDSCAVIENRFNNESISKENLNEQATTHSTMLSAATSLKDISSPHKPQYITMKTLGTFPSTTAHTVSSPNGPTTTDGAVYQVKSEIIFESKHSYQQQQSPQSLDSFSTPETSQSEYPTIATTSPSNEYPVTQYETPTIGYEIKFENGQYEVIRKDINDNRITETSADILYDQHSQEQQEEIYKFEEDLLDGEGYEEFETVLQSTPNNQREEFETVSQSPTNNQQQTLTHQIIDRLNKTITKPIAVSPGVTLPKIKKKQGEYLEKMSVRGLDIQRYEHIVDGVSYCLVCAKNDVYKTFKNKYSFQRHAYLFHEGDNRKIFACPICNKEFSRPDKMKMHKKDKHGDMVLSDPTIGGDTATRLKNNSTNSKRPLPAKRSRNSRSGSVNINNNNIVISNIPDKDAAAQERLAKIDSILDEVQNAHSKQFGESLQIQQQNLAQSVEPHQQLPPSLHQLPGPQQQLPSLEFCQMISPGGAELTLANSAATSSELQSQHTVFNNQSMQNATITAQNHPPCVAGNLQFIYLIPIDFQQHLLQQQLQEQSIVIKDGVGNLIPLHSFQSLDYA